MNFYDRLAPTLIGVSIALVQSHVAVALSPEDVSKIAKQVTVLIQSQKPRYGSGVIIKRVGNTYTILTAAHVIDVADKYEIVTADNQHYQLNYSSVKQLPGVDLAVAEFTSSRTYTIAKMGNSDTSIEGTKIYVAGYPEPTFAINQLIYTFTAGDLTANASIALRDGYALVYSNETKKGMSGGAVLNNNGELVGIHGRADLDTKQTKTGFNLGIPINTYLKLSATSAPQAPVAKAPKAADFYLQAGDKYQKRDYNGAIADYTAAIRLNPNYVEAYNNRGAARDDLGDKKGAITDYNQALRINPNLALAYNNRGLVRDELGDVQGAITDYNQALHINPNLALAYNNRGNARKQSGDKKGAIADYNQALHINPNYATAYYNRGSARYQSGDVQGAIADYNQALRINPNDADAYNNRGSARYQSGDVQGAIADYNQALRINPNLAQAYNNRGLARKQSGDLQGAIADYNQTLRINPNDAKAYNNRGSARYKLGDMQGAIADYNQALHINPNYDKAYNNRGIARSALGDKLGAIADLQKAADLFRQQGKTDDYQKAQDLIKKLQ